jgi:hypothetical protein
VMPTLFQAMPQKLESGRPARPSPSPGRCSGWCIRRRATVQAERRASARRCYGLVGLFLGSVRRTGPGRGPPQHRLVGDDNRTVQCIA